MNSDYNILIVEDEKHLLRTMSLILTSSQYNVTSVANGQDALQYIINTPQPIDLLITDIQMPGMSGNELIDRLKRMNLEIPILVITGFGKEEVIKNLMIQGVLDFICKPFTLIDFEKRVSEIILKKKDVIFND